MKILIEEFLNNINDLALRDFYLEVYQKGIEIGLIPKRSKTKDIIFVFTNPKAKRRIMKFTMDRTKRPKLFLRYNDVDQYSEFFHEAIRLTIEKYDYKYTGCYQCGKCDGTSGYTYKYDDGREYYRCPIELIELYNVSINQLDEMISLLREQIKNDK